MTFDFFGEAIILAMVAASTMLATCIAARQLVMCVSANRPPPNAPTIDPIKDYIPTAAIVVPAHNEESVIAGCIEALGNLEYPSGKLSIIVVNDRSQDRTGQIADQTAARFPNVRVLHRSMTATPGKAAAVAEALQQVTSEIVVLFDADYLPTPRLVFELVAPFADPTVGATMGRVVPKNSDATLMAALLDLERRAGYAVDQHGREMAGLLPQFGGTVGGLRLSAVAEVGGWGIGHLTEDTDLTFRLVLGGWRIRYLNHAACYEEVPEDWQARFRQVRRWAYGHNDCMLTYIIPVLRSKNLSLAKKADGVLILLLYFLPALLLMNIFGSVLMIGSSNETLSKVAFILTFLSAPLALAPYLQAAVAATRDRQSHVLRMLPLLSLSTALSMHASTVGFALLLRDRLTRKASLGWDKTRRYRQ